MSEDSEGRGREKTQGTILVPARYAGTSNAGISLRRIVSSRLSHHIDNPTTPFFFKAETTGLNKHILADLKQGRGTAVYHCVGLDTASFNIMEREPDAGPSNAISKDSLYTGNIHAEKNVMRLLMKTGGITKQ
jgi:hypothetical protein